MVTLWSAILLVTTSWWSVGFAAEARPPVRFGVQVAPEDTSYEAMVEVARLVEQLGYDTFWLNDHFAPVMGDKKRPHFESWTLLTALATQTQRIRLGILVSGNTYRHPAVLAKMATTVDHVSKGRLELGLGAGWEEFEHRAYGIPFYSAKERAARLGEALAMITDLWDGNEPSRFAGTYYQLHDAPFLPRPVQQPHPPIVVGGQGEKWIMPLVARYADEWNVPIGLTPDAVKQRLDRLRDDCAKIDRTPCVRQVSVFLPLANITDIPLAGAATRFGARVLVDERAAVSVLAGSADEIKEKIRSYLDVGATSVIITTRPSINHELMKRFASEIMPAFRPSRGHDAEHGVGSR